MCVVRGRWIYLKLETLAVHHLQKVKNTISLINRSEESKNLSEDSRSPEIGSRLAEKGGKNSFASAGAAAGLHYRALIGRLRHITFSEEGSSHSLLDQF